MLSQAVTREQQLDARKNRKAKQEAAKAAAKARKARFSLAFSCALNHHAWELRPSMVRIT